MCAKRDDDSTNEIEITAEMIEAGVSVLLADRGGVGDGIGFFSPPDLAERVYRAMASRRCPNSGSSKP